MKTFHQIAVIWAITLVAMIALLVSSNPTYGDITVEEAAALMEARPHLVIVDVRTPAEFQEEHLDGAINLCIRCDPDSVVHTLDPDEEILLYCHSGVRSAEGLEILNANGYAKVYNMLGGILAWKAQGYIVVK